MQEARGANRSGNKFTLPKFQGKMKALIGGIFATEKRTRFLQDYMNGLVSLNDVTQIKLLFTCTLFEDFIDLMSKLSKDGKEGILLLARYKALSYIPCLLTSGIHVYLGHAEVKRKLLRRLGEYERQS